LAWPFPQYTSILTYPCQVWPAPVCPHPLLLAIMAFGRMKSRRALAVISVIGLS
jgi:hypothetical protein